MWNERRGTVRSEEAANGTNPSRRPTFGAFLRSEPTLFPQGQDVFYAAAAAAADDDDNHRVSNASTAASPLHYYFGSPSAGYSTSSPSPYLMSPLNQPSPYDKSPWIVPSPLLGGLPGSSGLVGSLVRKEGHVYSLAATGDLLYTGSDSKNIRVWKNFREFSGFKSNSGLVKAIIISGDRVFTGHQDGKIRVWKKPSKDNHHLNNFAHKRIGSLPTLKDYIKSSINPKNYVEVRRHSKGLRIKHFDAVSSLSLNQEAGILYSGSWDKTMKVWRLSDSKHLESVDAHDDAINAIASGFDDLVFTGSADGTVKVWRRELHGKGTRHFLIRVLLDQESAVTSLAVGEAGVVYSGSSDGTVNFWTRNKHLCHGGTLRGHKLAVLCLAAAGNLVLSGSADKRISVWRRDPVTGAHSWLSVLTGHGGPIKCLAVEQERAPRANAAASSDDDGDENDQRWIVYSGSLDKSVRIWSVSEHTPEMRPYSSPWHSPERLGKQS